MMRIELEALGTMEVIAGLLHHVLSKQLTSSCARAVGRKNPNASVRRVVTKSHTWLMPSSVMYCPRGFRDKLLVLCK
jgi:hypothetical protein